MKDVGKILIYTVSEKLVESFQVRSFQNKLFKEARQIEAGEVQLAKCHTSIATKADPLPQGCSGFKTVCHEEKYAPLYLL